MNQQLVLLKNHLHKHDEWLTNHDNILKANKEDREELHRLNELLATQLETDKAKIEERSMERYNKLLDKQTFAEKQLNQSISLLSKELEKLKYEISDVIDTKFEHITKSIEDQTAGLKGTFDNLTGKMTIMSKELASSFKDKVHTIKTMCSTYFAKIDTLTSEQADKVDRISVSHDKFVANFVNPAKEVDAKVFAMQNQISQSE